VVAITLPDEVVRGLKRIHSDLAWAIVRLFERRSRRIAPEAGPCPDCALVGVTGGRSLIVVNRHVVKALPGVNMIPLDGDRAFLALDRDSGVADLELAVLDRLADRSIRARERTALARLRAQLRRWRRDPALDCQTRAIIVVHRAH
jgi:hypothetical protein